jgi:hypothetical protein
VEPTILSYHFHSLGVGDFAGNDQYPPHQTGAKLLNGRDHFSSGHLGAPEIQKDRVKTLLLDHCQRLLGIVSNVAFASQSRQQNVEDIADGGFVLDDENIAKLVVVVQNIPSKVGQKHLRLLA